jgi:tripartite-type tricarboxylate transporter receptor subunit TctC
LLVSLAATTARGQDVADFYRNRTLDIVVGTGPGGGYDANARLLARHIGKHIPGNPTVVVTNMPGGGGITATNWLYNVALKTGAVIGTFSNAMLTQPLIGADSVKFESTKLNWVGSLSREDGVCIASRASGVTTFEEFRRRNPVVGATAPGTTTNLFPTLVNKLLDVPLRLITGYADGSQIVLALQRGEVEAVCQTWSSLKIAHPDIVPSGAATPVLSIGLGANPELANLPAITDLARTDEQRAILRIVLAPTAAGRPFAAPPGAPPERVAALRRAFDETTSDPAFIEDARRLRVEVSPTGGAEMDALMRDIHSSAPALIERTRMLLGLGAR